MMLRELAEDERTALMAAVLEDRYMALIAVAKERPELLETWGDVILSLAIDFADDRLSQPSKHDLGERCLLHVRSERREIDEITSASITGGPECGYVNLFAGWPTRQLSLRAAAELRDDLCRALGPPDKPKKKRSKRLTNRQCRRLAELVVDSLIDIGEKLSKL